MHALCNVQALITNGLLRLGELADEPEESFTYEYVPFRIVYKSSLTFFKTLFGRQRREHRVFEALLQMIPGLEDRLMNGSEEDIVAVAELVS